MSEAVATIETQPFETIIMFASCRIIIVLEQTREREKRKEAKNEALERQRMTEITQKYETFKNNITNMKSENCILLKRLFSNYFALSMIFFCTFFYSNKFEKKV